MKAKEKERETSSKLKTQIAYMVSLMQEATKSRQSAEQKCEKLMKQIVYSTELLSQQKKRGDDL